MTTCKIRQTQHWLACIALPCSTTVACDMKRGALPKHNDDMDRINWSTLRCLQHQSLLQN